MHAVYVINVCILHMHVHVMHKYVCTSIYVHTYMWEHRGPGPLYPTGAVSWDRGAPSPFRSGGVPL